VKLSAKKAKEKPEQIKMLLDEKTKKKN